MLDRPERMGRSKRAVASREPWRWLTALGLIADGGLRMRACGHNSLREALLASTTQKVLAS